HVNVVWTRQVVVVRRAQEAEAVWQYLEHAFRENEPALLGLRLQDLKDQILLAHAGGARHREVFRDLRELLDAHVFQIGNVQALTGAALLLLLLLRRRLLRRRRLLGRGLGCGLGGVRRGIGFDG